MSRQRWLGGPLSGAIAGFLLACSAVASADWLRAEPSMPAGARLEAAVGHSFFRNPWVEAPASTSARDGLGPLYNSRACINCHLDNGRGALPAVPSIVPFRPDPRRPQGAILRLARLSSAQSEGYDVAALFNRPYDSRYEVQPGPLAIGRELPGGVDTWLQRQRWGKRADPVYGAQLQNFAIPAAQAEGRWRLQSEESSVALTAGREVVLRRHQLVFDALHFGPIPATTQISLRLAPALLGLGLLEAIPEVDLVAQSDPYDRDGDGISGRVNRVWDWQQQRQVVGRFGWKAAQPNLYQQTAAAFAEDMGLSSHLYPQSICTAMQLACRQAPGGDVPNGSLSVDRTPVDRNPTDRTPADRTPEVSELILQRVTSYVANLSRQSERQPIVSELGQQLFHQSGCAACHRPFWRTGESIYPWLSQRTIAPYTDLLLHDMGSGLADAGGAEAVEFLAQANEWRTPPLWGLGAELAAREGPVAGAPVFLHDGRAKTLLEAILWHGGEAQAARQRVQAMSEDQRQALLAFLRSL